MSCKLLYAGEDRDRRLHENGYAPYGILNGFKGACFELADGKQSWLYADQIYDALGGEMGECIPYEARAPEEFRDPAMRKALRQALLEIARVEISKTPMMEAQWRAALLVVEINGELTACTGTLEITAP